MKVGKRTIGLHLRVQEMLPDIIPVAQQLELTTFQSFVSIKGSGKRLFVDKLQIKEFVTLADNFDTIFFHASYKINPSSCSISYHYILEHEVRLVKRLGSPNLILHPGSAAGCNQKADAIDALARTLNVTQKKHSSITFILENVAHGDVCIGCDIDDFGKLLGKLDYPDRVQFCIDTAHAFSYGYDIRTEKNIEEFVQLLDSKIGVHRIKLLHINDTNEQLGSKHDEHAILGQGNIGLHALRTFAMHPKLAHIPLILELPELGLEEYRQALALVKAWHV